MRFSGLRAVVTGAASGIGAEVARSLTAEGAAVAELGDNWDVLSNVADVPGTASPTTVLSINEGLAWFAAHPQEGNTDNFSKEALIVSRVVDGADDLGDGGAADAVSPGPVRTPNLGDFEETMGKDTLDGVAARRHRTGCAVPGLARGEVDQRPQHRRRRGHLRGRPLGHGARPGDLT